MTKEEAEAALAREDCVKRARQKWCAKVKAEALAARTALGLPPPALGRPKTMFVFARKDGTGEIRVRSTVGLCDFLACDSSEVTHIRRKLVNLQRQFPDEPEKWFRDTVDDQNAVYRVTFESNRNNVFEVEVVPVA